MNPIKIIIFSILPALFLFVLVEGASRLYWSYLEENGLNTVSANGERVIRNDAINFMKQPDAILGYRLRSNIKGITNSKGFSQVEEVEVNRDEGTLRIMAIGESTTQGNSQIDSYPNYLSQILNLNTQEYKGKPEVINAGVSGWLSDQWTIFSETELNKYSPDVVIIYGGWNDFWVYDPFIGAPPTSRFDTTYGSLFVSAGHLKSITLASAIFYKYFPNVTTQIVNNLSADNEKVDKGIYYILFENMIRTINAFRSYNPNVKIVISSLVSRWPLDTEEQFISKDGHVRWMPRHQVGRNEAALLIESLNKELQQFVYHNDLIFVDMAKVFSNLDRQRLMNDFAHMQEDGYRIMAATFYEELNKLGIVRGVDNSEYELLLQQYALSNDY
jgi:lysophospholipase L1-like esterase